MPHRGPNAIDFWRGLALVMIFINHIPGHVLGYYTLRNFAISDAAELFVFLAGWSLSRATGGPEAPHPPLQVFARLWQRAIALYQVHLVITLLALASLAATARATETPIFVEWHNAGPAFFDPMRAYMGLVSLAYQLGYFNILPLYIVLLILTPPLLLAVRANLWLGLAAAASIYLAAMITRVSLPHWPAGEPWYFNPLCWQLLIVLGFAAGELSQTSRTFTAAARRLVPLAVAGLVLGLIVVRYQLYPDPMLVPEPRLLFVFNKTYLSPARLLSLGCLVIAFHLAFDTIDRWLAYPSRFLCALGRNSLAVFSVGSLLALWGQIVRFLVDGDLRADVATLVLALVVMGLTAWFVEQRGRSRG